MPFTQATFGPIASHGNSDIPNTWTYATQDLKSEVTTSGYFDDKINQLTNGDFVFIKGSDFTIYGTFVLSGGASSIDIIIDESSGTYVPVSQATRELTTDDTQLVTDRLIFVEGTVDLTMIDPNTMSADVLIVSCISGSCSFTPTVGTVETATLTTAQSVTLVPRASDNTWRAV